MRTIMVKARMRNVFSSLLLAVGLLSASTLAAQEVPSRAPVQAVETINVNAAMPNSNKIITVPLNGSVAVKVDKPVANIIMSSDIVDITSPRDGADRNAIYVIGKKMGSTSLILEDARGRILSELKINVSMDVEGIKAALADLLPDEQIQVTAHGSSVFLKGFARSAGAAASAADITRKFVAKPSDVINMIEILGSQQVIIKVHVAEANRIVTKNLGVNLSDAKGSITFNTFGANDIANILNGTFGVGAVAANNLGITVRALERQGLIKTLAEPSLTAISGETASFLAGGEYPFPTGLDQNGLPVIEFKEFGIRLSFSPTVIDQGRINLRVATEVSEISTEGQVTLGTLVINSIKTRRANTTVDLPSGGSIMMAGMLKNDNNNNIRGLPFLKDVPILGALFRSQSFDRNETELMITVTAYLAKPVGNDTPLALPSDGFAPANDLDAYLLGNLHRRYVKTELPPYAAPLVGPYGYIME